MVGTGVGQPTGDLAQPPALLDRARLGAGTPGERRVAALDRMGRCEGAGALARVSRPRCCRRTAPSLDGSAQYLNTPERGDRMTDTNRPIGLEAGSSSARWPGSDAIAA